MKKNLLFSTIFILLCVLTTHTKAYVNIETSELKKISPEPVEHIEVVGEKPIRYYKKQYQLRRDDFFKAFNALLNDSDFTLKCRNSPVQIRGQVTRFKRRKCEPRFVSRIKAEELQNAIKRTGRSDIGAVIQAAIDHNQINDRVRDKRQDLAARMGQLISINPELREKYDDLKQAKLNLDAKKSSLR